MTQTQQFIIELLKEGKGYIPVALALLAGWHIPTPTYMRKKDDGNSGN